MKLHVRLILTALLIILIASVATSFIYYQLTSQLIYKNHSQAILNSTNDFVFNFQNTVQTVDEEFRNISSNLYNINKVDINSTSIDFLFTLIDDSLINLSELKTKQSSFLNIGSGSFKQLFVVNPNIVLRYAKLSNGNTYYYGFLISSQLLDRIASKIRSDIALFINNSPVEFSNSTKNQFHLLNMIKAFGNLKDKNNYDLYFEELDNEDFLSSTYTPNLLLTPGGKINFLVFNTYVEGVNLRSTLRTVMIIIVLSASALSFIVVLLFTTKLRKQISLLNEATETTRRGNLKHRVPIISNDEIGKLGEAFNKMLDEIERKDTHEKEYTEFIKLINQNPTLNEVSDAALHKIIKTTNLTFGLLFILENKKTRLVSTFGIGKDFVKPSQDPTFYDTAIEKKEVVEFNFKENFPEIKTGLAAIKIKYLLIYPIIYNKETIAILELASESEPAIEVKNYIDTIQDQLAVGLINAQSLEQLENFVNELKKLNEEYQKQNEQIIEQNEKLKDLHKELNEKATELERQRSKAIELTKVKSQFLASMSHELRTPLISILGLTELILKDSLTSIKSKERLNVVHRNGKKLLGLITNILEFSKFESGKIEIKKDNFFLKELLDEIKSNFEPIAFEKKLQFIINFNKEKEFLINTDKSKLEQILNNLLLNAFKYTEHGKVKLSISLQDNNAVRFSVKDTGIGILPEDQKFIFSEFKQINGGIAKKYGGAGLGLTICKRYVELLGGNLSVTSEPGKGSEFYFELNDIVLDVLEITEEKFLSVEVKSKEKSYEKSVLLFCRTFETYKLISDYLSSYDLEVIHLDNYNDSIKIVESKKPTAAIICVEKNVNDHWLFVKDIKSQPELENVIIILLSINEEEKVGWFPNIFDFIVEPVNSKVISKTIQNIELFSKEKVSRIVHLCEEGKSHNLFSNDSDIKLEYYICRNYHEAIKQISRSELQLLLIDNNKLLEDAFQLLLWITEEKLTKNIIPILIMSRELSDLDLTIIQTNISKAVLNSRKHPLDVLKDIKERLKLDDVIANKKYNLIEDLPKDNFQTKIEIERPGLNQTILIVDDDPDTLFTIGELVKELGYDTLFAHNGTECLLMLNHINPHLILLDIMMPQMDGFETIKRIRNDIKFSELPVIALTAYAMLDNKDVVTKNGFDDIVTKPVNSSMLASKIDYHLKLKNHVV